MSDRVDKQLYESIKTMRNFCDDAERFLLGQGRSDLNKAAMVLHQLSWGFANASMGIETAIASAEHDHERHTIELEQALQDMETNF